MKVVSLHVYPVKSFKGVQLEKSQLSNLGLSLDRNWMLVDENHKFMTQREFPKMALFVPQIGSHELTIGFGDEKVSVPFEDAGDEVHTKVWGQEITGKEVTGEISQWIGDRLGTKVKLIHFSTLRNVENGNGAQVPFTDSGPFHLISEGSLVDLNTRMDSSVSMQRFRPNIVISGAEAFQEDSWKEIKIGENRFKILEQNARCQLTNVNPETGDVDKNVLKVLSSYRNQNNKINFGVHLCLIDGTEICVDDEVEVIS